MLNPMSDLRFQTLYPRKAFWWLSLCMLMGVWTGAWTPASAESPKVLIAYRDKAPLSYTVDGKPKGVLIDKTVAIFRAAGLTYKLEEMPLKRITKELELNREMVCSPGWYKLPEREELGLFTLPIHRDAPRMLLVSAKAAPAVRAHPSLHSLMQDTQLSLAVIEGLSYGPDLDRQIAAMPRKPIVPSSVTALVLPKMVALGRADYMFIDQADLDYFDRNGEMRALGLEAVSFPDMPAALQRHLWCNHKVNLALMRRLDAAIHKLGFDS